MNLKLGTIHRIRLCVRQLIPNIGSILFMAAILFAYNARATVLSKPTPANPNVAPKTISYQCTLFDSSGNPVTGNVGITFRFYNALTDGTKLWEEAHTRANAMTVDNGLFHVLLGSLTLIPASVMLPI